MVQSDGNRFTFREDVTVQGTHMECTTSVRSVARLSADVLTIDFYGLGSITQFIALAVLRRT